MIHPDCSVAYLRQAAGQLLVAASSRPSGGFSKLEAHVGADGGSKEGSRGIGPGRGRWQALLSWGWEGGRADPLLWLSWSGCPVTCDVQLPSGKEPKEAVSHPHPLPPFPPLEVLSFPS